MALRPRSREDQLSPTLNEQCLSQGRRYAKYSDSLDSSTRFFNNLGMKSCTAVSETSACNLQPPTDLAKISEKIVAGQRITRQEAEHLYHHADLLDLGRLAAARRQLALPGKTVTYLIDRNINYTNVCHTDCTFCGFYRHDARHPESYVNSRQVISKKIEEALALGATRILFQGGHNDELPYQWYVDIVEWIHQTYPAIEINAFSPSEIEQMKRISGKSYEQILGELKQAGMRGLPGGGAEILDDDVRRRVSPKKIKADEWISVMEVAQGLELTTTGTMVIGFGETIVQRLNHLDRLRAAQDRSTAKGLTGFNAFISWPLQLSDDTSMGRSRHAQSYGATAIEYLRNVALCRIYLDNIVHHQASWPTLGAEIGMLALHFGCDDMGSTMMEENVVSSAGALTKETWSLSPEQLRTYIQQAGFIPAQRDTSYQMQPLSLR